MNILIFGATGMVGQGVLRECLLATDVARVVAVGRTPTGVANSRLRDLIHADLFDYRAVESELEGFDACFFCLGVSSAGMSEADYSRMSYDLTLAAAEMLARLNSHMTFVYVSGAGTDSSEKGPVMWARVKGRTENALRRLPFKAVYLLRPGVIQPLHGARSRTGSYRIFYSMTKPLLPLLRKALPNAVLTTESMGKAMLALARDGWRTPVLETRDIAERARG
jgi:uncharacterized protein YbjT (DUF2867 family)